MVYFKKLYDIEDIIRQDHLSYEQAQALRLEKAKPILDKMREWLDKSIAKSPPKGTLGKAIHYMLNRWSELTHYLNDGRLDIDNNLIENAIRPFAIGKKNWMFKGSPRGARAGAVLYSLIATAKANQLEPFVYLKYIFERLPLCTTVVDYQALLPWNITEKIN